MDNTWLGMDTIWLGSGPTYEPPTNSARRYRRQIERHYGKPPRGAKLHIRRNQLYLTYRVASEDVSAYALAITFDLKGALLRWDKSETPLKSAVEHVAHNVWTGLARAAGFTSIVA